MITATLAQRDATPAGREQRDERGRLRGIDTIRAFSAAIVVLGHLGLFYSGAVLSHNPLLRAAARISAATWNGPAAVIIFFIISGFCIHLPFRGARPLEPIPFLVRRLVRVAAPAAIAYCLAKYVVHDLSGIQSVLWSIVCEAIYYVLYPVIRPISRKTGWRSLALGAYLLSLAIVLTHLARLQQVGNGYDALGPSFTWLIGLPCWLLGCLLAEHESLFPLLSPSRIWSARAGVFLVMLALRIVKFHAHGPLSSNCITLNLFALGVFFWLGLEITYFKHRPPPRLFEWMGEWSYSLYLMHPLFTATLIALNASWLLRESVPVHLVFLVLAFGFAYLFHRIVERPSHKAAVFLSRNVTAT